MDRKTVIVLVLSFLLLVLWMPLVNWLYPPKRVPAKTNQVARATNQLATTNVAPPTISAKPPSEPPSVPRSKPSEPEKLERIQIDGATYVFTSHGGGLKEVEMSPTQYPETVRRKSENGQPTNGAILNRGALSPVLALSGHPSLQDDDVYRLTTEAGIVRAEKHLSNGLYVIKAFQPTSNYLVNATVRIENRGTQAVILPSQHWIAGTASPVNSKEDPIQLGIFFYDGNRAKHIDAGWFANRTLGCLPGTPRDLFESTGEPLAWAAVHNRFFTLATVPQTAAPKALAHKVDLALAEKDPKKREGFEAALVYPSTVLETTADKNFIEHQFTIYAGPKEYNNLVRLGDQMKNNLDYVMKFNGFFGYFSRILLMSMNGIHDLFKLPYGWSIIVITVIIKLLFWPLTRASTRSMKRMAALQPEMKKIQEKYKGDPQKMNKKVMEYMKEHKVNPIGGCLPMIIQIPVFFGFYFMIQSAIELRGAGFLWAWDLSVPDTIATVAGFPINPLPVIMGATMLWQASLTPPSPSMDPAQQKIMKYMPLIFLFVLYNMSSGLTLYWTVQNILTIVQTKLTKTDEKKSAPAPAPVAVRPVKKK